MHSTNYYNVSAPSGQNMNYELDIKVKLVKGIPTVVIE